MTRDQKTDTRLGVVLARVLHDEVDDREPAEALEAIRERTGGAR